MEFENLDFYDEKSLLDYSNKIRNEINNVLVDLRKRDTIFDVLLLENELDLFNKRKSFISLNEQEVIRLSNLIEIFRLLESLLSNKFIFERKVNLVKSLINGD